jgi:uncharacterized protein
VKSTNELAGADHASVPLEENRSAEKADWGLPVLAGIVIAGVVLRPVVGGALDSGSVRTWSTVFVAICLQALPFLALGVALSGLIAALLRNDRLARILPKRPALAVPIAGICGVALPGCECGSVPIAGRLMASGVHPAAALTFLLSAPSVNPVVLVATAVAFPNDPRMWVARLVASMLTSVTMGWLWVAFGRDDLVRQAIDRVERSSGRWERFRSASVHDILHAGGYLVVGAAAAATIQIAVPKSVLNSLGGNGVVALATMAVLAVLLSICSEADAFVAVGLSQFGLVPKLVFLTVGPAVDLKLIAMQGGVFGRRFARVFAPATLVVATGMATIVGTALL